MKIELSFVLAGLLSVGALAQPGASVAGGPLIGHVFDKGAHALRPVRGVPGAATLGDPLEVDFSIDQAAISSEQGYALVIAGQGTSVRVIRWNPGMAVSDLPVVGTAKSVRMSPRGMSAAVISDGWLGLVTGGMTANPQVSGIALSAQPVDLAVSDDGAYAVALFQDGTAAVLGSDGSRTALIAPAPVSKVAFRPGSTDALLATSDNRVFSIRQVSSSTLLVAVAGPQDGVSDPVGLAFLSDGRRVAIASSGNGTIQIVDLSDGSRSSVMCACKPVQLERTASANVFNLTEPGREPQYFFDASSSRTFFVPAAPLRPAGERRPRN